MEKLIGNVSNPNVIYVTDFTEEGQESYTITPHLSFELVEHVSPAQFSWVPEKMSGGILKEEFRPNKESAGWIQAERAAKTAIYSKGTYPATHFHATWIQKPASWSKLNLLTTCGQHHFYS